jgi:hypothetical protein
MARKQSLSIKYAFARRYLRGKQLFFETHNDGAHLVVHTDLGLIDFWPGTGKFIPRDGRPQGVGLADLMTLINPKESTHGTKT